MKPLKFGIIGTGIGKAHANALKKLADDAKLVAVADIVQERAVELANENDATAYADHHEMLAKADLDVVCVCTPSGLHGQQAIDVINSGRNVIVEKPMAIDLDTIEKMLELQTKKGVKLAVISQHRFDEATKQVKVAVDAGRFGKLALGDCQVKWYRSQEYYDRGGWRGTWAMDGGGSLMNQSIHSIDLLQWLMGPVDRVKAYMGALTHKIETEDTAVAVLQFKSGAIGVVEGTTSAYPSFVTRVEICGSKGTASIENDHLKFMHFADEDEKIGDFGGVHKSEQTVASSVGATEPLATPMNGHAAQIMDMIQAIREKREPLVNGFEGRKGVAIIRAIYESATTNQEVSVRWS